MLDIVLRSVNKMGWVLTLGQGAEKINTIWNNTGGCPPHCPHTSGTISWWHLVTRSPDGTRSIFVTWHEDLIMKNTWMHVIEYQMWVKITVSKMNRAHCTMINPSSFCSSQLLVKYLTSVFSSAVSVLPDYQEQARQRQRQVMMAAALTNIPTLGQF